MLNHYHMANEPPPRDTLFSYLLTQELFEDAQEISVDRRVVSAGVVLAAIGLDYRDLDPFSDHRIEPSAQGHQDGRLVEIIVLISVLIIRVMRRLAGPSGNARHGHKD